MRSELFTDTTVRASTRVVVTASFGTTTAEASAGAAMGTEGVGVTTVPAALATVVLVTGAGVMLETRACCTTSCWGRAAAREVGARFADESAGAVLVTDVEDLTDVSQLVVTLTSDALSAAGDEVLAAPGFDGVPVPNGAIGETTGGA